MRVLVVLLALGLIPLFVGWQKHHYESDLHFDLATAVAGVLDDPEFGAVQARLEHLDVTLTGRVDDFALRSLAARRVDAVPGARVRTIDNRIRVVPLLDYQRGTGQDRVEGRLHSEDLKTLTLAIGRQPIPEPPEIGVQGHPLIEVLEPRQRRLLLGGVQDFMVLPGPRSLTFDGDRVELAGAATLEVLARLWEQAGAGPDVEQALYQTPLYASVYHLPGHRAETGLDDQTLDRIRTRLGDVRILFAADSAQLAEGQHDKLEHIAEAVRSTEGQARFVIGGHVDGTRSDGIQAGIELGRRRAEVVRAALVELGLADKLLEVVEFGPTRLAGEPQGTLGHSVEVLLK